jgi:hypothetical protein
VIAAIATVRDEADILPYSIAHLKRHGVEDFYFVVGPSSDETEGLCREVSENVWRDGSQVHYQPHFLDMLAKRAHKDGAKWILPFDADEFPYATNGESIPDALGKCPAHKLYLRHYQHRDREWRKPDHARLPKVAYRYSPQAKLEPGNHDVSLPVGLYDVLDLREIPYRSFEHFQRKVAARIASLDPRLPEGSGWHITRLAGFSEEELRAEYDVFMAEMTVHDPIP